MLFQCAKYRSMFNCRIRVKYSLQCLKVAVSVVVMVAGKSIFRVLYFSSIPNMEERGNRFCDCRESPIPSLLSLLLELLGNRSEKLLQPITLEVCVCVCVCVCMCACVPACVRVCVNN